MNTTNSNLETDNLVLFPSAKNFKTELSDHEHLEDPMMDLLNEFNQYTDDDIKNELLSEDDLDSDTSFDSLEAFMSRHNTNESLTSDDKLILAINESMESLKEAKERLKFYLDDLEMFLPTRR
jgi:hypothetical protein